MPVSDSAPLISIVIATYNRSNILQYAIESVIRQTIDDWEVIVIGDCCTDDSESVVRSFQDKRIHWHNLAENFGEQSYPNNVGVEKARGKYVCFLNHDDLYFPDHLELCLERIRDADADLVFAAIAIAKPRSIDQLNLGKWDCQIRSVSPTGKFELYVNSPASSWMAKRDALIGCPWPDARDCFDAPSQNVLTAMYRKNMTMVSLNSITLLVFRSAMRENAYENRDFQENEYFWRQMCENPRFREVLMHRAAMQLAIERTQLNWWHGFKKLTARVLAKLGIRPQRALKMIQHRRRGAFLNRLRKKRGLGPLPEKLTHE